MRRAFRLALGRYRLLFGFCPMCNSSPPQRWCPVCHGDKLYGHDAYKQKRQMWWGTFRKITKEN